MSSLSLLNHAMSPKMNTRNIQKNMLVLPFFTMLWNGHKAKIIQCPSLFGTKNNSCGEMWCTCIPCKNHQVTQLHQREISQILSRDSGGSRLNIDLVILDHVSSITLRQTSLGQLKSWKHLISCGIQALRWQLFPHGSIQKNLKLNACGCTWPKSRKVAWEPCGLQILFFWALLGFISSFLCRYWHLWILPLKKPLMKVTYKARPWMQLLDRLPNSRV